MKVVKKIISIILVLLLTFTGENIFFIGKALKFNTYAETTLETDISYDNFSDASGLQINGEGLIVDGAIQFESNGTGESIFTSEKIQLGTDYSFSTSFTFKNISSSELNAITAGGFTFTLQPLGNTLTSNNLNDNKFKENFSIGFITKYTEPPTSSRKINENNHIQMASIDNLYLSYIPYAKCEIYYSPYIDGLGEIVLSSYMTTNETSEFFKVWIGYDDIEKKLETLILDDLGNHNYRIEYVDLTHILNNEVYAGFMGSLGDAKNINEIGEWHFRSDTSLIDDILIGLDTSELESQMDIGEINSNLYLPTKGRYGSNISWKSSDPTVIDVIEEEGIVNTPGVDEDPKQVTLTATISRGRAEDIVKTFNYIVTANNQDVLNADYNWLEYKEILNKNYERNRIFSDLSLPRSGKYGSDINWISSSPTYLDAFGKVTNPSLSEGDQNVTLTATISKGGFSQTKEFDFIVIAALNDSDRVYADSAWLHEEILNGNSDLRNIATNLNLHTVGINGSSISWLSNNPKYIDVDGTVYRPTYEEGDMEVTLTATINYGSVTIDTKFYILVKAEDQSDKGKVQDDLLWLNEERILNVNTDINNIVKDLNLPTIGEKGSIISWESSDITVVNTNGTVNRPKFPEEDKLVTLTATVTSGSFIDAKTFNLLIKAMEATNDDRVEKDSIWLDEEILKDNSSLDNIMTDLNLPVKGFHGSNISWTSSDTRYIEHNGKVTRPDFNEDMPVTLTATIQYDSSIVFKNFKLIVKAIEETDEGKVQDDYVWLNEKIILDKNLDLNNITSMLHFPSKGLNGSTISWESSNTNFVYNEGIVVRPIFVQGDQTVKLTATLSLGEYKLLKTFTVIVKVGYLSAEMTVSNDLSLLDEQKIKNENIDLNNVIKDLILPTRGDYGSYIRWESSDIEVVNIDGKVNRPKFTEIEKIVELTAFVSFDTIEDSKKFTVTVKPIEGTDEEIIEADSLWIEKVILKENSNLDNIMTDLYLPTEGKYKSHIEWYSSYPEFIDIEGKVNRPSYSKGDTNFSLVATITKGDKITVKPFLVTVEKLPLTTSDGLKQDLEWLLLNKYSILNENISEFSVTDDLSFPKYAPINNSTIKWESDNPEIIENTGYVNRPQNGEGNKLVKVTATLTLDSEIIAEEFIYTVLEVPEGDLPKVISTTPENNNREVSWDTTEVVIEFDEDIIGADGFGIGRFNNQYVIADIYRNTMRFSVESFLNNGENIVSIPAGTVKDKYGNLNEEYEFSFTMDEKVKKALNIISSNPANLYTYLPTSDGTISLKFDESNLVKGERFENISFKSKNYIPHENGVDIEAILVNDSLNIKINEKLYHGIVYELVIPQGVVGDKYKNTNKESILQFRTVGIGSPSTIKSIYPYNGQFNVSTSQDIEINFSSPEVLYSSLLVLKDETGKIYKDLKSKNPMFQDTTRHIISVALEPNKDYTLSGPYKLEDSSELSFELNFRTGNNSLPIAKTYPVANKINFGIKDDIIIEFDSDSPIVNSRYVDNSIIDSKGKPVAFQQREEGNKVILSPLKDLEPGMMYTVHIPAGKYKNINNSENDDYRFSFYTSKPIEVDSNLMNIPNMWFIYKNLDIDGSSVENYFFRNRRSITSFQWDLGDGTVINDKKLSHRYYSEEYYRITLKITDDKGFEYELEDYISLEPISQVDMSVMVTEKTHNINDALVMDFNIVLEQNGQPIPGESVRVDLFKDGGLQRTYNVVDTYNKSNYKFTFIEEKGLYAGVYELVFTYESHGKTTVVKEYINIPGEVKLYPFILHIYDRSVGKLFSDSNILYVKINGERYPAYRTDGDFPYYTVKNKEGKDIMLQHGVKYYIELEGWIINTKSFSITKSINFINISGYPIVPMSKDKAEIVDVSIELPLDQHMNKLYIEGAKINEAEVKIQGIWNDLKPGYYEMKSEDGDIYKTFKTDTFKINPSETLKYGNKLMFRMISDNGISSPWKYADILVAPQPTIKGKKFNVNVVNREYRLSFPTVFDGVVGGAMDILKDIPLIDNGNFGIGEGIPDFSGPVYQLFYGGLQSNMDFEAGFKYDTNKKQSIDTKIEKVKKVTSVGYSFDFNIEGDLMVEYYDIDDNWGLRYAYVLMSGSASRKQSSGYTLFGVIGIEAYFTMGVRAEGTLQIKDTGSTNDYNGNISLTPVIAGGASGNYGLGEIGGFIEASLPVTMYFPSNIIEVEANIEAKIENVFAGHKEVLLNKKYNAYKWSNRSRSLMRALLEDEDTQYVDITLLPRDYIGRTSNWVANDNANMSMRRSFISSESNLSRKTLMENVYPYTDLQLVESNGKKYLIWVDDNIERDAINRTQLKFSVLDNGKWSEPQWIDDDKTADFTPTVAAMENGLLMAWQNIGKVFADGELKDSLFNSEISVTENIFTPNETPTIKTLTADDKVDHSPKIASNNEKALLVWTKSEGLNFSFNRESELLADKNTDSLYFSQWASGKWSEPEEIEGYLPTVVDSNLYMNDGEGLLLYTLDMDNDFSTMEDREIFARIYNGSTWEDTIRITNNNSIDSNPQAVYLNDQWFITWIQDGNIKHMESLNGEEQESEFTNNIQNNYQLIQGKDLVALVYRTINEQGEQQIGALFYDIDNKTWGDEVVLTESGTYSSVFHAAFTENGEISIAYGESKLIKEVVPYGIDGDEYLIEEINISDKVDIKTLDYTPIRDLSISDSDILLSSEIPIPGTIATVYANVNNEGDFAEKALVELYDGNPNSGGIKLAEYQMTDYIPARSSREVGIHWLVDTKYESKYELYVVVSSLNTENNYNNNMASTQILTTDLAILDIQSKHSFEGEYSIEVLVKNNGATKLDNIQLVLEDESGKVIEAQDIEFLDVLESQYIIFTISSNGLTRNQSGEIKINAKVISPIKEESNLENNIFGFTILPKKLLIDNINISQGQRSIGIEENISIGFNMDIDKGRVFDNIALMDANLNTVSIEKDIEGRRLIVTPVDRLNYNTNYSLILPNNALIDSFNNVINDEYSLTFTTIGTNPEIIFAYPGNNMEDVGINSSIGLKFNQNVKEGSSFSYIALYDNNSDKVVINKALKDDTLTINAIGNLKENTTYTLEIPNRAIQNENGEVLNEHYILRFSTGLFEEEPKEPKEPDEPDYQGGNTGSGYQRDNKYSITTDIKGVSKQIKINIINRGAIINLEEYGSSIFTSGENIIMNLPIIPNIDLYRLQIPSNLLASEDNKSTLTLNTDIGSITISSGILRGIAEANKGNAEIILTIGDKAKLTNKGKSIAGKYPIISISILVNGEEINYINWNNPLKISIPYKPTDEELENIASIIIWDIGTNKTILPNGYYDEATGMVTFITNKPNYYAVGYNPIKFNDVNTNNWYEKAVSFIAARNITTGTGNGNYSPNSKLTRGQFIVLLMKTYGFNPNENSTNNFADAGNTYYTGYLSKSKELGISNGIGNNLFAPEKEITRQEMFTMIYNTLNIFGGNLNKDNGIKTSDFLDSSEVASWAKEPIDILVRNKIISGSNGRLNPSNITTRAEIAQVLYNLLYSTNN